MLAFIKELVFDLPPIAAATHQPGIGIQVRATGRGRWCSIPTHIRR